MPTFMKFITLVLFAWLALAACSPRQPVIITPTTNPSTTPLPSPQAVELGVLGKGAASDMVWSPDGCLLAVLSSSGIYLHDTQTWQVVQEIHKTGFGGKSISSFVFSRDQKSLIVRVYEYPTSSFWRYDLQTDQVAPWLENLAMDPQTAPVFSPDGKNIAFLNQVCEKTEDGKLRCVNALELRESATGELLHAIAVTNLQSWKSLFVFSPDGQQLAVTDQTNRITLWDVSTALNTSAASGKLRYAFLHDSAVASIAFSADSQVLASASKDASVRFWDTQTGRNLFVLRGFKRGLQYVAYRDHDKKLLVGQLYDNDLYQYALDERCLPTDHIEAVMQLGSRLDNRSLIDATTSATIRLSPDTSKVAVLLNESIQIWDVGTGQPLLTLPEYNSYIHRLAFSADGDMLATADYNVHLWDVSNQKLLATLPINAAYLEDISFRPHGHQIAVIGAYPGIQIWDTLNYQKVRDIVSPEDLCSGGFSRAVFSPDGAKLATVGYCGVMVWDAETGAFLQKLETERSGSPYALTFSAAGEDLVYIANRGIWRWNLATGKQVYFTAMPGETDFLRLAFNASQIAIENRPAGAFQFFDPQTGQHLYDFAKGQNENEIALQPGGRLFARTDGSELLLTDSFSGEKLLSVDLDFSPRLMLFSPASGAAKNQLALSAYDGIVHLWDVSSVAKFASAVTPSTATPNPALIPTSTLTPDPIPQLSIRLLTPPVLGLGAIRPETISKIEKREELGLGQARLAAWAADGKTLAVSIASGVYIFKLDNPRPVRFLSADGSLLRMDFSADGSLLAGQMGNSSVQVWDVSTGHSLYNLENIGCWNYGMTFSPNNQTLSADCFSLLYRWSLLDGRLLGKDKQKGPLMNVSSDGRLVAQAGMASATLLDANSETILQIFEIPEMAPALARFSPDGKTLLVWFYKFEIARSGIYYPGRDSHSLAQLWDVLPGQVPVLRATFIPGNWRHWEGGMLNDFQALAFSADGRRMFTSSGDGQTQIWEVSSGRLLATLPDARTIYPSKDGNRLIAMGNAIRVWDVSAGRQPSIRWSIPGFDGVPSRLMFTTEGELIAVSSGAFHFWPQKMGSFVEHSTEIEAPEAGATIFLASPNGKWLAYSTFEKFVVGKNDPKAPNWQTLKQFPDLPGQLDLRSMRFSPDSTMLATLEPARKLLLWRLGQPQSTVMELASDIYITRLRFSPNGKLLLGWYGSTSEESDLYLWDTATGKLLRKWNAMGDNLAFHPDGVTLAIANSRNGFTQFFDLRTWRMLREIKGPDSMDNLVFSPDGSLLASVYQGKVEFRDVATGQLARTLEGNFSFDCLAFSPDGKSLALGLWDGRIQVWGLPEK